MEIVYNLQFVTRKYLKSFSVKNVFDYSYRKTGTLKEMDKFIIGYLLMWVFHSSLIKTIAIVPLNYEKLNIPMVIF